MTEALRLVIGGDSKGAQRALSDLGREAKNVEDNPLRAFRRGLSLGGDHAISFRDRIGLVRTGLTKLRTEGMGGMNAAFQNFGTAASGAALQAAAWGTAIVTAAATAVVAVKSVIDEYIKVGIEVGKVSRIVGTDGSESASLRVQFKMLGLDVSSSADSLGMFSARLGEVQATGTGPAAEAFARLGVDLKDQNGEWKTNAEVLAEARDKLSVLKQENLNLYRSTSRDIFGRGYMSLDKWLGAATEKIAKFNQIAEGLGTDWDDKSFMSMVEDSREMGVIWEDLKTTIGQDLVPLLRDEVVPALKGATTELQRIPNLSTGIGSALSAGFSPLKSAGGLISNIFGLLGSIADLDLSGVARSLWEGFKYYIDLMLDTFGGLPRWIQRFLEARDGGGSEPVVGMATSASGAVQPVAPNKQSAQQVWNVISGMFPGLANEGLVKARPGGTIVRVAEGGEDEVVLKASRLRGGGGKTFHIDFRGAKFSAHSPRELMDMVGAEVAAAVGGLS